MSRQSSSNSHCVLGAAYLPHPTRCVQHPRRVEVLEGLLVGRRACITITSLPGRLCRLRSCCLPGTALWCSHCGKEPPPACADDGCRSNQPSRTGTAGPLSLPLTLTSSSSCNLPTGGEPAASLTPGTPALRPPRWQVEVELPDRMDQLLGTKSASSNLFCWESRRWGSPAWSCVLSRGSSTSTRRAQLEVSASSRRC